MFDNEVTSFQVKYYRVRLGLTPSEAQNGALTAHKNYLQDETSDKRTSLLHHTIKSLKVQSQR